MTEDKISIDGQKSLEVPIKELLPGEDSPGSIIFNVRYKLLLPDPEGMEEGETMTDGIEIQIEEVTAFDTDQDEVEVSDSDLVDLPVGDSSERKTVERTTLLDCLRKAIIKSIRDNLMDGFFIPIPIP